jgi:hypothetical protein
MSFASSLLAMSIHSLASQPTMAAHAGIEVAFANFFSAMGANVAHVKIPMGTDGRCAWRPDAVIDFGDFQVILEISSHESEGGMAMYQTKNGYTWETHHHKIKQALAYSSKIKMDKPTVCMVASNLEFVAFNPSTFNLKALQRNLTNRPSQMDGKACRWVKKQAAFKVIKKHQVETLSKFDRETLIAYFRTILDMQLPVKKAKVA